MSVAPCRACGQQVSVQAPACPHCGHPSAQRRGAGSKIVAYVLAGLMLAAGMACTIEHQSGRKTIFMPYASFKGALDRCDQASAISVADVRLK